VHLYSTHVKPVTNYLFCEECQINGGHGQDLIARNIQRGRDHGIPGWIKYRQFCRLTVPTSFSNRPSDISERDWVNFQKVYTKVEDIDLFTGGISETPVEGGMVGATFACIIAKQFAVLKGGDRFFFTHPENGYKYEKGLPNKLRTAFVTNRKLSDIVCDNTEIDSLPQDIFNLKSNQVSCNSQKPALNPYANICESGWNFFPSEKKCYRVITTAKSWTDARSHCQSHNGELASVPNSETNVFLSKMPKTLAWIGGHRVGSTWKWSDGSKWSYSNWDKGQPDNCESVQDKAVINYRFVGHWDDDNDKAKRPFICQKAPAGF